MSFLPAYINMISLLALFSCCCASVCFPFPNCQRELQVLISICTQSILNSPPHLPTLIMSSTLDLLPKLTPVIFLHWGASKFCQSCGLCGFVCLYLDKSIGFVSKVLSWLFPLALGSAVFTQNTFWAREVAFAQRAPSAWGSSCWSPCEAQEKVLWARSGQEIKLLFPP